MLVLGSHVSLKGDDMYLGSVKEALSYHATAMMVYTGAPQNTYRKSIENMRIKEALELMKENNFDHNNVVVHAPYIINLANPSLEKREFAVSFLTSEILRTHEMKVNQMVLHPGSAVGLDRKMAVKWIAEGLNKIIENTKDTKVKIALETMAGKGNEVGRTFNELRDIIDLVNDKSRVSVCFDTCHVFDSGYDLKDNYDNVLKEFDNVIGLDLISVIHVNDSKNILGSRKDRHENIGFGNIGYETLFKIIYDERFLNIPKILETPYIEKKPPYKEEIKMIRNNVFNPNLKASITNNIE